MQMLPQADLSEFIIIQLSRPIQFQAIAGAKAKAKDSQQSRQPQQLVLSGVDNDPI